MPEYERSVTDKRERSVTDKWELFLYTAGGIALGVGGMAGYKAFINNEGLGTYVAIASLTLLAGGTFFGLGVLRHGSVQIQRVFDRFDEISRQIRQCQYRQ